MEKWRMKNESPLVVRTLTPPYSIVETKLQLRSRRYNQFFVVLMDQDTPRRTKIPNTFTFCGRLVDTVLQRKNQDQTGTASR